MWRSRAQDGVNLVLMPMHSRSTTTRTRPWAFGCGAPMPASFPPLLARAHCSQPTPPCPYAHACARPHCAAGLTWAGGGKPCAAPDSRLEWAPAGPAPPGGQHTIEAAWPRQHGCTLPRAKVWLCRAKVWLRQSMAVQRTHSLLSTGRRLVMEATLHVHHALGGLWAEAPCLHRQHLVLSTCEGSQHCCLHTYGPIGASALEPTLLPSH